MRLSNTGFRPPVHDQVTPYEIPPIGPRPLVEPPLQNDDSRVRGVPRSAGRPEREADRQATQHPNSRPGGTPRPDRGAHPASPRGPLGADGRALDNAGS